MRTIFMLSIDNEDLETITRKFDLETGKETTAVYLALLRASSYHYKIDVQVMKVGEVSC